MSEKIIEQDTNLIKFIKVVKVNQFKYLLQ